MTPGVVPQILPSQPAKQNSSESGTNPQAEKENVDMVLRTETDKDVEKEKQKAAAIKPEDLVLKPSPTTLEERMNQIISEKEVKDLLSMVTGAPVKKKENHKVDVKR